MIKKHKNILGFTLVEMLVSVGIVTLLSGVLLTYSSRGRGQVDLFVEKAEFAQTILRAKSLTLSTYNRPTIPCGYGIHINYDLNEYSLFSYEVDKCSEVRDLDPDGIEIIDTSRLQGTVIFDRDHDKAIMDILFFPPDPDTWVWQVGSLGTSSLGEVRLATKDGSASSIVVVSQAGQISF